MCVCEYTRGLSGALSSTASHKSHHRKPGKIEEAPEPQHKTETFDLAQGTLCGPSPPQKKKTMSRARGGKRNAGRQDAQPSKAGTKPEDKKKQQQQQQQQQGKQNVSSGSSALNDSNDDALPRLDIEKENGQFKEIAERINAAYTEIVPPPPCTT